MNSGRFESWLRCPCCVRRAEHVVKTMHRRVASALAAVGLAALAGLCLAGAPARPEPATGSATRLTPGAGPWWTGGSAAHAAGTGKVALLAIAVAAAGAFVALQLIARSRHRRPLTFADWRTWPPGYDPGTGIRHGDPAFTDRRPWMRDAACLRYVYR